MKMFASSIKVAAILSAFIWVLGPRVGHAQQDQSIMTFSIGNDKAHNARLEVFNGSDQSLLYDTGIIEGGVVSIPIAALDSVLPEIESLKYELRAWDAMGELLLSQVSTVSSRVLPDEISSISFSIIPAGSSLVGDAISLQGSVDVDGDLDVSGRTRTAQLQDPGGSSFFDSCPVNSSIRSISATGTVICEVDSIGGADNLGNHTATQDLLIGDHYIDFSPQRGLRAFGGGEIKTGPLGQTFQFHAGGPTADIARFWTSGGERILRVNQSGLHIDAGGLHFDAGQKICSCYDNSGRNSILVSARWTSSTCSSYRNAVCPSGQYQLFCISNTGFSFGTANGGIPSPNCGW